LSRNVIHNRFDTLGLLGASGAGKVCSCVALRAGNPDSGCIVLNGHSTQKLLTCLPAIAGSVFCFKLRPFPTPECAQNIAFGLQHLPKPQRDRQVNCRQGTGKPLSTSGVGGQQRFLASFSIQPKVLLLDEPFSALDTLRSQMEQW